MACLSDMNMHGHSLRGLCGLKYCYFRTCMSKNLSQPARAVWIEILNANFDYYQNAGHSLRGLCGLK